jgi:hypothetical protein
MRNLAAIGILCAGLAGCAGSSGEGPCEVFSPAEINLPTTQDDQRIDEQSTGDPTRVQGERNC